MFKELVYNSFTTKVLQRYSELLNSLLWIIKKLEIQHTIKERLILFIYPEMIATHLLVY